MELVAAGSIFPLLVKHLPNEIHQYLNKILEENLNWQSISNIVKAICLNQNLKNCQNCGKQLKYSQHRFCSVKCAQNTNSVREKAKLTNKEKYGVEFPIKSKEILKKRENNNFQKYRGKKSYSIRRNSK